MEREIEENTIKSESEQVGKRSFWQSPKIPLFFGFAAGAIIIFLSFGVFIATRLSQCFEDNESVSNSVSNKEEKFSTPAPKPTNTPQVKKAGGICTYKSSPGICKITSILDEERKDRSIVVRFEFEPTGDLDLGGTFLEDNPDGLTGGLNTMNPLDFECIDNLDKHPAWLEKEDLERCGIVEGSEFDCLAQVITKGTCSPVNFDFLTQSGSESTDSLELKSEKQCYHNPREALNNFLNYLYKGKYDKAVDLYGGDYGIMEYYNPDVDPQNRAGLLERWCTVNSCTCLEPKILSEEKRSEDEFWFGVEFYEEDGEVMELGYPGGGSLDVFHFSVLNKNGCWIVENMPPYSV